MVEEGQGAVPVRVELHFHGGRGMVQGGRGRIRRRTQVTEAWRPARTEERGEVSVDWMNILLDGDKIGKNNLRASVLRDLVDGDAPRELRLSDVRGYRDRYGQSIGRLWERIQGEGRGASTPERLERLPRRDAILVRRGDLPDH